MSSDRTTLPFNLSEQTRVRLPLVLLLALLGVVASAAIVWNGDHRTVADQAMVLVAHDQRLRRLEESQTSIAVMQRDVDWIRKAIERDRNSTRTP